MNQSTEIHTLICLCARSLSTSGLTLQREEESERTVRRLMIRGTEKTQVGHREEEEVGTARTDGR